ncbi:Methyl-CpG-binding domain protein 4 [Ancistrocladus abbreviatus]
MKSKEESPKTAEKSKPRGSVDIYAAQCGKCLKWRTVDSLEDYEEMRSRFTEDPFFCHKKPNVTCDDPADIEFDSTRTWVIDKPNIPKTPDGFKREVILRRDFSKLDAYYVTPTGKRVRTRTEVAAFIKENPRYKDANVDDFNFTVPKVLFFWFLYLGVTVVCVSALKVSRPYTFLFSFAGYLTVSLQFDMVMDGTVNFQNTLSASNGNSCKEDRNPNYRRASVSR